MYVYVSLLPVYMYVIVRIKAYNCRAMSVVCTKISGREPHRQVSVGRVVSSGSLDGVMVNTLDFACLLAGLTTR